MKVTRLSWGGIILAFGVTACTAGATGPPPTTSVNPAAQSALQFAVGTANLGGVTTGMNVVVTNRQANGQSGVLLNTPTLTGPFTLPAASTSTGGSSGSVATSYGPSAGEVNGSICGAPCITGTPQTSPGSSVPFVSTFGTTGGVFGLAFAPDNSTPTNTTNTFQPYPLPMYGAAIPPATAPLYPAFLPWGGPPAYDPARDGKGTRDGTFADATRAILGVQLGISVFERVAVNPGAYNLSIAIPNTASTQTVTAPTFTLGAVTPLATLPTVNSILFDGTGQVSVSYTLPPGVVGAYVEIVDNGPSLCNGSGNLNLYGAGTVGNPGASAPGLTYYTFWVTASGTVTATNAMSPGPPGTTFPAVCTAAQNTASPLASGATAGDAVSAYVIGFDYNHYALTYNGPLGSTYPQRPALPASADMVISAQTAASKATSP